MAFVPRASLLWRAYRRVVRTHVAFFAAPDAMPDADIMKLYDLPAPYPGIANTYQPTIQIDLQMPLDALWNAVNAKTRKVMRQAEHEGVDAERIAGLTPQTWGAFAAAFAKLAQRKCHAGVLGVGQIGETIAKGAFVVTRGHDAEGHALSWHGYVCTGGRARLLYTISDIDLSRDSHWNNFIGRSHRLHYWRDILRFRQDGVEIYDLGGVFRGTENQEQANITRFKSQFGGHFADTYHAVVPLTRKGRLALALALHMGTQIRGGGPVLVSHPRSRAA